MTTTETESAVRITNSQVCHVFLLFMDSKKKNSVIGRYIGMKQMASISTENHWFSTKTISEKERSKKEPDIIRIADIRKRTIKKLLLSRIVSILQSMSPF